MKQQRYLRITKMNNLTTFFANGFIRDLKSFERGSISPIIQNHSTPYQQDTEND